MSELDELLDRYFSLGVAEGKEGRTHDTQTGEAQATRDLIMSKIERLRALALQPLSVQEGWRPIETAPKDRPFLAYGSYFYPGDLDPTVYTMIAEVSLGDPEWPYRSNEGTHRKGFFSHWVDLPTAPTVGGEQE